MSESNEEMENQSSDEYQVQNEEWDEAFRGTLHTSARSERIASRVADPIQREAAAYFTPQRKRKSNEIHDETMNTQLFLNNIRDTGENNLTFTTKEDVMRYHGITAEYRSTTIRMRGKQLLGKALGQLNLPVGDLRRTMTNGTGQIRTDDDAYYNIAPSDILNTNKSKDPICWLLTLITLFYAKNISDPNFDLSNKGQPIRPDTTVFPEFLPTDSSLISEFFNWLTIFQEFCKRHCPKAWILWSKGDTTFPVLPKVEKLAKYMEERNLHNTIEDYTSDIFYSVIHDWAVENIVNSTANASHFNVLGWLDSMLRKAASKVPLLNNKLNWWLSTILII